MVEDNDDFELISDQDFSETSSETNDKEWTVLDESGEEMSEIDAASSEFSEPEPTVLDEGKNFFESSYPDEKRSASPYSKPAASCVQMSNVYARLFYYGPVDKSWMKGLEQTSENSVKRKLT